MSPAPTISIIVAVSDNGVIGKGNALPWRLSVDLRYFKKQTMGKPVIMGRKTWQSIGKALPGRHNIVVSGNPDFVASDATVVDSLDAALAAAQDADEIMIIGGETLYRQALAQAARVYLTRVHVSVSDGDAYFPALDASQWRLHCENFVPGEGGQPACTFRIWDRA